MTFVYENKEWYFGYIDHFRYKQVELKKGNITLNIGLFEKGQSDA